MMKACARTAFVHRAVIFLLVVIPMACRPRSGETGTAVTDSSGREIHVGALETFRYWADAEPTADTQVLNGQYWSSSHFTKEYIMYLELRTPWAKDFPHDNGLERTDYELQIPTDAPAWFIPPDGFEIWKGSQGSRYFIDPETGHMFIYEVQL